MAAKTKFNYVPKQRIVRCCRVRAPFPAQCRYNTTVSTRLQHRCDSGGYLDEAKLDSPELDGTNANAAHSLTTARFVAPPTNCPVVRASRLRVKVTQAEWSARRRPYSIFCSQHYSLYTYYKYNVDDSYDRQHLENAAYKPHENKTKRLFVNSTVCVCTTLVRIVHSPHD